jgi:hypothetical protein
MDAFLTVMDSVTPPSGFLLHGLAKAVVNGYKHATFLPSFRQQYFPLRETPRDVFVTPALLRHLHGQLGYLLQQARKGALTVSPTSSRPELRSHQALAAFLAPLHATAGELLAAGRANVSLDSVPLAVSVLNKRIYQRPFFGGRGWPTSAPQIQTQTQAQTQAEAEAETSAQTSTLRWEQAAAVGSEDGGAAALFINSEGYPGDHQTRRDYIARAAHTYSTERVVYLDDFLTPAALEELYLYCVESTVFHVPKASYVGSYQREGFSHPLLVEVAAEIAKTLPFVADLPLVQMWAYSFDQTEGDRDGDSREGDSSRGARGIRLHMDAARVNLNVWLTPDDANLDPSSGGLVVFTKSFVDEMQRHGERTYSFADIQDARAGEAFLRGSEHLNITVPHRRNRVVIFDSTLWHATDHLKFKTGHKNRRINLTFLFGRSVLDDLPNFK